MSFDFSRQKLKIPATIITGFLGAGKTTLVRNLLMNIRNKKVALIVNEFGDMGFDGDLLSGCNTKACATNDVIELTNGCICCTVADDFLPAIEKLLKCTPRPEHILIETSGLALPQPLIQAFGWPDIKSQVTVDGVITVVDAEALAEGRFVHDKTALDKQRQADEMLDHETPVEELFEDQMACADLVVVAKSDMISTHACEVMPAKLQRYARGGISILFSDKKGIPASVLLGLEAQAENDLAARHSHHNDDHEHDHNDFETFVVSADAFTDKAALETCVQAALSIPGVLRVKGFAAVKGKASLAVVQGVGRRVETYFSAISASLDASPRLVVIGETGFDSEAVRLKLTPPT